MPRALRSGGHRLPKSSFLGSFDPELSPAIDGFWPMTAMLADRRPGQRTSDAIRTY